MACQRRCIRGSGGSSTLPTCSRIIAHERGSLTLATLIPALPLIEREVAERFPKVLARQRREGGTRWRFEEEYVELSHEFGAYLDLLSLIPGGSTQVLQQATAFSDP